MRYSFVRLQFLRHQADYDNAKLWTGIEAQEALTDAREAFANWRKIGETPVAQEFLINDGQTARLTKMH